MRKAAMLGALGFCVALVNGCALSPAAQRQRTLNEAPKWYQSVPRDKDFLLTTGTAESPKLELAVELASATARSEIARNVELYVKAQIASIDDQDGRTTADENLSTVTSKATSEIMNDASATISRSRIRERKVAASSGGYRAWILMEIPSKEVDKAIRDYALNRVKSESDERLKARFQKLLERTP